MKIKYKLREIEVGSWVTGKEWLPLRSGRRECYKVLFISDRGVVRLLISGQAEFETTYNIDELVAVVPKRPDLFRYHYT